MRANIADELHAKFPFALAHVPELECGDGWQSILAGALSELTALSPAIRIVQIKEKWGALRIYYVAPEAVQDEALAAVLRAEKASAETCEFCGAPGILRTDRPRRHTLCADCADRR